MPLTASPATAATVPATSASPARPPTADEAVAHTLLNCLLREVCGPERQATVDDGRLLLRLPRRGVLLRVALRRTSLLGAHRFRGPVAEWRDGDWAEASWRRLAEHVHAELSLRTGVRNDEFLEQVESSHRGTAAALAAAGAREPAGPVSGAGGGSDAGGADGGGPLAAYLRSEQSLPLGHRFHPAPKARGGDMAAWAAYAPEAGVSFPLRHLAVRTHLVAEETAAPGAAAPLDRLRPVPDGYRLLPVHPWQHDLLAGHPGLRAALDRGDVLDLGAGGPPFTPTASVRTLHAGADFLKFSLNVRITNCVRKNSRYELSGAVALTRLLRPVLAAVAARHPAAALLREPAYRSLALPGPDGAPDVALLEGFGVIVREGLTGVLRPGVTPLLAGAVADEYPTGPAHVSRLPAAGRRDTALDWWTAYLKLLVPPVLAAYFDHGVVLEPHLQNVLLCVDADGMPAQVVFRDLEGTKLLPERHAAALAALPAEVAGPMTYDAERGWHRVVYCLLVNHVADMLAALADLHPQAEHALWARVRGVLLDCAGDLGDPPRLRALLAGAPLPAKANLLTRWRRRADRDAGYVHLPNPIASPGGAPAAARRSAR